MSSLGIPVVVREIRNQPLPGHYLATRNRDGYYFVKVNYAMRQSRKWLHPDKVEFKEPLDGREVFVDKYTQIQRAA